MGQSSALGRNGKAALDFFIEYHEHKLRFVPINASLKRRIEEVAIEKYHASRKRGDVDRTGDKDPEILQAKQLLGAMGEFAANAFYIGDTDLALDALGHSDDWQSPDLGSNCAVRTRSLWRWELNLATKDVVDKPYVLVTHCQRSEGRSCFRTVTDDVMAVRGWIGLAEGKRLVPEPEDKGNKGQLAHWVPADLLYPPETLVVEGLPQRAPCLIS